MRDDVPYFFEKKTKTHEGIITITGWKGGNFKIQMIKFEQ